ncbi:hypothetical protein AYI68_g2031 [Smittium mucronatum]|uniref:Uncharacterized protein n=1 Tax=Smittium mucronatum TaxID=133383 RepID=A0A1R0GMK1_9FUNG|nr:hypothetical protein AYI68_g7855 [Smittium mucronatum]OLY83821.1 hypothetical protein AYI68_g2031 [Smittium mucronatum]
MNIDNEVPPTIESLDMLTLQLFSSLEDEARNNSEKRLAYFFPTFSSDDSQELIQSPSIQKSNPITVYHSVKTPSDTISFLFWFLNNTNSELSLFFAVQRIKFVTLKFVSSFSEEQKIDLANTILTTLSGFKPGTPRNLVSELSQSLAYTIISGYLCSDVMADFIDKIILQVNKDSPNKIVFLQVLNVIIEELNREIPGNSIPKKERIVSKFKDSKLKDVFSVSLNALKETINNQGLDSVQGY